MPIALHDITIAYGRQPAVHHLSGQFATGSLTAVVGPNGAGKSTLIKAMAGLLPVESGRIHLDGLAKHDIAYLPQQAEIDRSFPISVQDMVMMGLWRCRGGFLSWRRQDYQAAQQALQAVGIAHHAHNPIGSLSIGQFHRALFARLMLQQAKLILLDEPFNAVDSTTTADLLQLIQDWHRQGRTVVCVLHDLSLASEHFPETLVLAREAIAWGKTAQSLSTDTMTAARNKIAAGY
ncbi:MAG: ABC transporter ATP-binding protein [Alphaproteobacteria bacterium]|nr:ABC transporter ATP-binding protein [Alphaproteobacteria bacterium]